MAYSKTWTEYYDLPRQTWQNGDTTSYTSGRITLAQSRSGSALPYWKQRIREGSDASTPFATDRVEIIGSRPGRVTDTFETNATPKSFYVQEFQGFFHNNGSTLTHLSGPSTEAKSIALSKTYKKLQSEMQHLNSPAIIAEFLDVIRQFGKPADALVDLTNRHLNRLELEKAGLKGSTSFKKVKWAQVVAKTYLEWSFGLDPIIDDTRKVAEAFGRWKYELSDNPKFRSRISCRAQVENGSTVTSYAGLPSTTGMWFTRQKKTVTESRYQYVCGLRGSYTADFGSGERLQELLGFNHRNWIPAAWNALPWSWLVDYFSNVGNILEAAVTSTAAVEWLVETESRRSLFEFGGKFDSGKFTSPSFKLTKRTYNKWGPGYFKARRTTVSRLVPQNLAPPPLYFKHPFGEWRKTANLIAVLLSRGEGNSAVWIK